MASVPRQITASLRNGVLRPQPDPTYADGDDETWLRVDWPALTSQVEVRGSRVNVVDTGGDGPAVLLVHGLGGRWQNWLPTIPPLMDRFRVIAPDLPGFGASEMPAEPISIAGYARIVDELCAQLGVTCAIVVGNSMGGFVAAELAIEFPARVDRLVLVSAAGLAVEHWRREPLMALGRLWVAVTARTGVRAEPVVSRPRLRRAFLQSVVLYPERLSPPITWELVQGAGKPGFLPALDALLGYSFRDRLARIDVPVLIVWGRNDMLVPVADAALFERLIGPNARKVIFDDTGHVPMIERPRRFNALLEEFVADAVQAPRRAATAG